MTSGIVYTGVWKSLGEIADNGVRAAAGPPEPFDFSKHQKWVKWIRQFECYQQASNLHTTSEDNQVNIHSCTAWVMKRTPRGGAELVCQYATVRDGLHSFFIGKTNVVNEI